MPSFACETRDSSGRVVQKTVDASSQREAMIQLEQAGLFPLGISEVLPGAAPEARPSRSSRRSKLVEGRYVGRRIKRKELLNFSLQLGSSVSAGVPIIVALAAIARQTPNQQFKWVIEQMTADLEGGQPLSESMKNHPKTFPEVYSSTIAAGEETGSLDQVLDKLAEYIESEIEVASDVRTALLYPAMVICTLGLAITVLIVFVIPRFAKFYAGFNHELPLPTRILITGSNLMADYFLFFAIGFVAAVYGLVRFHRTDTGRRFVDRALLRIPVVRSLIQVTNTLHVTQMIGLFTQAGVPLLQGLRTVARTTSSSKISDSLLATADGVAAGESLADSLEAEDCLPPTARQMLAAGESTGTLERACFVVSKYFKKELSYLTKNLATLIEPLLTVVLAGIVLFVALAVFLPMWDLVKVIGN